MLVTGSYPPDRCGVGDYTASLAERLAAEDGLEVAILTGAGWRAASGGMTGSKVAVLSVLPDWRLRHWRLAYRAIRAWRADVVHLQHPTQGYKDPWLATLIPMIGFLAGARVVRTWHEAMSWASLRDVKGVLQFCLQAMVPGKFVIVRPRLPKMIHPLLRVLPWPRRYHFIPNASAIPTAQVSTAELARTKRELVGDQRRLIVTFGFLHPEKGVDRLFEIANPATDQLLIMGEPIDEVYGETLTALANHGPWSGRAILAGHQSPDEVARILAAADAVIFPFRHGGGPWNTSIHAARMQGAFIIATSKEEAGFDPHHNIFWAKPDDIEAMRNALNDFPVRRLAEADNRVSGWQEIIAEHTALYAGRKRRKPGRLRTDVAGEGNPPLAARSTDE